jgi:methionyl-tRNA formyltransferase
MKIVFIGTVELSKKALEKLLGIDSDIVGVCTQKKSNFNSDFADLTPLCKDAGIPYKIIEDINSEESVSWIRALNPDIIFCFGWSSLIKKELLTLPSMGIVGYHPAKLPQNRGRHPLIWSLILGLKKSASTFYFMDEHADSGDILSQTDFDISRSDDAQTLYTKVTRIALSQIEKFVPQLVHNNYEKVPQNHAIANTWRKRSNMDGKIDFRMSSETIYNLVRGLSKPYIGAHIEYKKKDIIVWKVKMIENKQNNIESGKVVTSCKNSFLVKTCDGAVEILEHEFKELPEIGEYL